MDEILKEFLNYAKEQCGYDINIIKETSADTFESIFGNSFFNQKLDSFFPEGNEETFIYRKNEQTISVFSQESANIYNITPENEFAA